MKKIIAFLLVVSMTAAIAVGGTLAYLTDRESEANVFTTGNVEIDLNEDFNQGAELIPGVNIEKKPTVTNVGPNDAWVWVEIAIPSALNDTTSASKNALHFNMSKESVADGLWNWWDGADYSEGTYMIQKRNIDGVDYDVYVVQYETALKAGETTAEPVIYKVYLDSRVDIDPDGNWALVENGTPTAITWNSNTDGAPVIYVSAYAMQTDGFNTVYDAYDAYQTQWADNGTEYGTPAKLVSTAEDLVAALNAGGAVVLTGDITITDTVNIVNPAQIDLNGHNLTVTVLEAKADTEITNGTLTHGESTYPAVSVSAGTLRMEDVDIVSENYCNIITSASGNEAAEYTGLEIWSGACILDDCTITVKTDKIRYSNSIFGVGIYEGEFTMNGGSITVESHGSTKTEYDYQGAIFAIKDSDKVVNLNGVTINLADKAYDLYAWGGNTTVNLKDVTGWDGDVHKQGDTTTYTINHK